jgi:hypothetical protein
VIAGFDRRDANRELLLRCCAFREQPDAHAELARVKSPMGRIADSHEVAPKLTDQAESYHRTATAGWIPLAIGLSAVILLWDLLELPQILSFAPFAFGDPGSNLTTFYLVSHGYRPVSDFGYLYGLLGILANMAWFRAVPLTPAGYQFACILCQLGVACAIARIARALAFGPLQLVFLFVAIGRAVMPSYWNFAHGLEAVLICFAVAEQARGMRANALALTTAAVFAKPSMGFVYSALLLTLMALDLYRRPTSTPAAWFKQLKPATIVGTSLCAILGIVFGVDLLWRTVIPISGIGVYRAQNMGFFTGTGSSFWRPAGVNWHYYAGTMIGLWMTATVYLICGAIPAAWQLWENLGTKLDSTAMRRDEIIFSCALLHLAFIFLFFGGWDYYSYLLIAGAAAVPIDTRLRRAALCAIIIIAAATYYGGIAGSISAWRETSRSAVTANLWSSTQVQDDWSRVLALSKGRRTAVLHFAGAVEILYPEFERPTGLYFTEGLISAAQIQHEVARIESADVVVLPSTLLPPGWGGYLMTPESEHALASSFKQTERGAYFSVYERR